MTRTTDIDSRLLARAERVIPGGVSSPVRAFRGVGGDPVFVRAAAGAWLTGEDGRRYLDYIGGYGPHILGHGHPAIVAAVAEALGRGTAFGAPTVAEAELAERIVAALPSIEMVRLVCSGTEATMSALRLARAATGREPLRQVHRLLPRPRRPLPRRRRLRRRDVRRPLLPRRAARR